MIGDWLVEVFPALSPNNHRETSPADKGYNCIAWAARDTHNWWEPDAFGLYFWPPEAPREATVSAAITAFGTLGFRGARDSSQEPGLEKVAVYAHPSGELTHMSRQLSDGSWTSKLGKDVDISHSRPEDLEGGAYGRVVALLERTVT